MAWTSPLTAIANAVLSAAQWNASVRDNLNETAVAKATTAGRIFVATGMNQLAEYEAGHDVILTSQTTTSTSYTDLATVGPTKTVTTGSRVIVIVGAYMSNNTINGTNGMSVQVSGATTLSPADENAAFFRSSAASGECQFSYAFPVDLTPGANTFTAKYKVSLGTGTFSRRRIIILPFG